ncbi:MAG: tetratricopeptide repeat protein, partial [Planctomycetia bacterium]|nr:tetratricopeptide repeat protein [Planctomycetia bacterium]
DAVGKTTSLEPLGDEAKTISGDAALLDKLIATARAAMAKDPASLGPHAPLGVALLARDAKRWDAVAEFFELALRATPDEKTDLLLLWGGGLLAEKKVSEAASVFRRGTDEKLPADDRATFYFYLCTALEMDGGTEAALEAARKAAEIEKDSPRAASQVAWVLYHAKRNAEARDAYNALIDKFDSDYATSGVREILREARLVLASLHVIEGRPTDAQERLEQVLDEFPDDVSAMNDLGYLWADENRRPERALAMVRRAVDAEPENAAYRDSLGWALYRLGRLDEAVAELQTAAAAAPEGEVLEHLGEAFAALKKTDQADQTWRKAAEAYRKADQPDRAAKIDARLQEIKKTKP